MFKLIVILALAACAYGTAVPIASVVYAAPATVYKTPAKDTAHVAVSNANGNYAYSISEHKAPAQTYIAPAHAYVAAAPQVHYVSAPVPYAASAPFPLVYRYG